MYLALPLISVLMLVNFLLQAYTQMYKEGKLSIKPQFIGILMVILPDFNSNSA